MDVPNVSSEAMSMAFQSPTEKNKRQRELNDLVI